MLIVGNNGANTLTGGNGRDLIYGWNPEGPQGDVNSISATRVASGLSQPLFVTAPTADLERLFVVEKGGTIRILDLATNQISATPFLDLTALVDDTGEQGLLGLAFDPNFAQNGFFYVDYINLSGDTEIRRFQVSANNPDVADPNGTLILRVDQPAGRTNHKAGWLGFGPDGYLYAALGDGGSSNDPDNFAQNINVLLGKMLRLDVSGDDFPADPNRNYAIPDDNPFVGAPGADEIYALGLRNPWRNSFDRGTGELFIADVGQGEWEEINLGQAGANYGWRIYEGPEQRTTDPLGGGALTFPIHVYDHSVGNVITGGYVYRGTSEGLHGHYFFADFGSNRYFTLHLENGEWVATERTGQIMADVGTVNLPASFGEDAMGNLYVVDLGGEIFRLTPNVVSADTGDTLHGGGGHDLIFGGSGDDRLNGGSGNDELQGGAGHDVLVGQSGVDLLIGGSGNDVLNGGTGGDIMAGGPGNDKFLVDKFSDQLIERAEEGTDEAIISIAGYTLPDNVENGRTAIAAARRLTGNDSDNYLIGNVGDDKLIGGDGDDRLDGQGGADTMWGGPGDDRYYVDDLSDAIGDGAGGEDTALVSVSGYTMPKNIETGRLLINGALTGNIQGDHLYGSDGSQTLNGAGGHDVLNGLAGADTLIGGTGNDLFQFRRGQAQGDTVVDFDGNGAAAGDSLRFVGYGTLAQGASLVQLNATQWQINSADGLVHEVITLQNGAAIHASDFVFL
jgi:Ca2+-binding RTX toxin-like protein